MGTQTQRNGLRPTTYRSLESAPSAHALSHAGALIDHGDRDVAAQEFRSAVVIGGAVAQLGKGKAEGADLLACPAFTAIIIVLASGQADGGPPHEVHASLTAGAVGVGFAGRKIAAAPFAISGAVPLVLSLVATTIAAVSAALAVFGAGSLLSGAAVAVAAFPAAFAILLAVELLAHVAHPVTALPGSALAICGAIGLGFSFLARSVTALGSGAAAIFIAAIGGLTFLANTVAAHRSGAGAILGATRLGFTRLANPIAALGTWALAIFRTVVRTFTAFAHTIATHRSGPSAVFSAIARTLTVLTYAVAAFRSGV